jgi:hypothetical protein
MFGKMKIFIGFGVVLISGLIYFATQVSATYDPLKTYQFPLTREELQEGLIKTVNANPNLSFHIKDTTGADKENLHYYADILMEGGTEKYEFSVSYNRKERLWDNNVRSEVSLIGVFDNVRSTGGYKKEDTDAEKLIKVFESQVINKIEKTHPANKVHERSFPVLRRVRALRNSGYPISGLA